MAVDVLIAWWGWIAASAVASAPLLLGVWCVDRLTRRRAWPLLLTCLWFAALARLVLPASFSSPVSLTDPLGAAVHGAARSAPEATLLTAVFWIWMAGAAFCLTARLTQRVRAARAFAKANLTPDWRRAIALCAQRAGVRQHLCVAVAENHATPAVFGLVKPTLLLPEAWLRRSPSRIDEHALLHEFTHVRQGDLWLDELLYTLRAVFWFHPLAWVATRRLRDLAELRCDEAVVRLLGDDGRQYRESLLLAARDALLTPPAEGVRNFLGAGTSIVARIERLERGVKRSPAPARLSSAVLLVVLTACILPMASTPDLRAQARQVLASARAGEIQSCFSLQAAALVLSADSTSPDPH